MKNPYDQGVKDSFFHQLFSLCYFIFSVFIWFSLLKTKPTSFKMKQRLIPLLLKYILGLTLHFLLCLFFALDWRMISLGIFILPIITWVLEIILHYYDQKRKNPTEIA